MTVEQLAAITFVIVFVVIAAGIGAIPKGRIREMSNTCDKCGEEYENVHVC